MTAREYLEQYKKLEFKIDNKMDAWRRLHDSAFCITAQQGGERVQTSSSNQKMADALDRCADLQTEISECYEKQKEIERTIEQLNAIEYDVLFCKYCKDIDYNEIAERHNKSYDYITTVHGRALRNLRLLLDKRSVNGTDKHK